MAFKSLLKSLPKSLPVRGRESGAPEDVVSTCWRQPERVAQALRLLGDSPITHARAERTAQRLSVHWTTIYSYGSRLAEIDEVTAIAGRTRGWKPLTSRLFAKRAQGIEEAVNVLRKKHGPLPAVDLVAESRGEVPAAPRAVPFSPGDRPMCEALPWPRCADV